MFMFDVPEKRKVRIIVDTDAKCEADDQFAIVHALLSPKLIVKGLIAAHFGRDYTNETMMKSYEECVKLKGLLNADVGIYKGAKYPVKLNGDYEISEGAQLIVKEAMSDDSRPLFVVFQGAITDLACAYLIEPKIADKLTAIWIGGGSYPDGGSNEFNMANDINAANIVFDSPINLWQVPMSTYGNVLVSLSELQLKVYPWGEIGKYLFEQMVEFNNKFTEPTDWPRGESWGLGDSPVVGLVLDEYSGKYSYEDAPFVDENLNYHKRENARKIRVYNNIDQRFILEDMFAKLQIFANSSDKNLSNKE